MMLLLSISCCRSVPKMFGVVMWCLYSKTFASGKKHQHNNADGTYLVRNLQVWPFIIGMQQQQEQRKVLGSQRRSDPFRYILVFWPKTMLEIFSVRDHRCPYSFDCCTVMSTPRKGLVSVWWADRRKFCRPRRKESVNVLPRGDAEIAVEIEF